jgi:ParB-like nuclease domain
VALVSTTFGRARRRSAYRRLGRVVRRAPRRDELLPLDEVQRRLRPVGRRYVGMRSIPVANVVGTDSRGSDFDRGFLPRRRDIGPRWQSVEGAFPEGDFPPIVVYRVGDAYFVIDGHHRVAIARQRRMETIDAEVTELKADWHLPANADIVEVIHVEQRRIFMEESGLAQARPDADIGAGRLAAYIELLENVQVHGYHLMLEAGRALDAAEIAADWHDTVYRPAVEAIHAEGLSESFPEQTDGELFLTVYQRRRHLFPDCGCPPLQETVTSMSTERAGRGRIRLRPR